MTAKELFALKEELAKINSKLEQLNGEIRQCRKQLETEFNLDSLENAAKEFDRLTGEHLQAKKEFEELMAKLEKDYGKFLDKET